MQWLEKSASFLSNSHSPMGRKPHSAGTTSYPHLWPLPVCWPEDAGTTDQPEDQARQDPTRKGQRKKIKLVNRFKVPLYLSSCSWVLQIKNNTRHLKFVYLCTSWMENPMVRATRSGIFSPETGQSPFWKDTNSGACNTVKLSPCTPGEIDERREKDEKRTCTGSKYQEI